MMLLSFRSSRAGACTVSRWRDTRGKWGTAQALALKLGIFVSAITTSFGQDERPPEEPDTFDLKTALSYALDNNFNIRRAIEQIEEQEGIIVEVKARTRPSLSLDANYQKLDGGLSEVVEGFGIATDNTWGISLNLRQALYQGGGIKAALKAQDLTRESVRLFLESTIMDAMLEVTTRYYGTLLARDQIEVEEQNVELLEETLEDAQNRLRAGSVSDFEVLRAEVLLANAKPALIRRRSAFRVAIDQLRRSIGYGNYRRDSNNLEKVPEFLGELKYELVAYDLAICLDLALSNRSELERLRLIEEARDAGLEIARSDYRPSVDLIGSYGKRKSNFSESFDDGPEGWTVGVVATWDIFDGAARKGRVRQARSQLEQSRIERDSLRLAIEVEVRQAMSEFREAEELVNAAAKAVEQAEEALRLADSRYNAGAINQLDVFEARFALTDSRTNRLEAYYRHIVAVANLKRAMGEDKPALDSN
ncbi:TolC family protein [Candidatus Pelagisphaera phototrophica]|uniref:TolC family protein n=1 Tax=Candidatus Pelagisphaera phototrophica TaxID=2684113 RepID=UPI0024B75C02|nr:TolC family protein [Candidatus Pelagisphaera phototrophica]